MISLICDLNGKIIRATTVIDKTNGEMQYVELEHLHYILDINHVPIGATHYSIDTGFVYSVPNNQVSYEMIIEDIRFKRSVLLQQSDWTQMPDSPLTSEKKAEWAIYRQALRDFPETCDINNPIWPTPPQ